MTKETPAQPEYTSCPTHGGKFQKGTTCGQCWLEAERNKNSTASKKRTEKRANKK